MSFSMVAVLLLLLSSFSIAIIHEAQWLEESEALPVRVVREMSTVAKEISLDIKDVAYRKAIDVIRSSRDLNESALRERFSISLDESLHTSFPRPVNGFLVSVSAMNATLAFMRVSMQELYPELEGSGSGYDLSSVPAYFTLYGNFTVSVEGDGATIQDHTDLQNELYLPFPLVANRIASLANAMSGGRCEFENIVRYELSALAQDRVLRGYGLGSKQNEMGTAAVITEEDVLRAMNLAFLLEQRRYLRASDDDLIQLLESVWVGEAPGLRSIMEGGVLDPADLFLSSYGPLDLDTRLVLSQSLYAVSDILVMKWMEFLHILDLGEGIEGLLEEAEISINELIGNCLGVDMLQDDMVRWISGRMDEGGYSESDYRYLHFNIPDGTVRIPARNFTVRNDVNQTFRVELGGDFEVDFPSVDIFGSSAWGGFLEDWKRSTFQLGNALSNFFKQVAQSLSTCSDLRTISIDLDPRDGTSYLDALSKEIGSLGSDDALHQALNGIARGVEVVDAVSEGLLGFLEGHWMEIFELAQSLEDGMYQIASRMVDMASEIVPHFGDWSGDLLESELLELFACSKTWNIEELVKSEYMREVSWRLEAVNEVFSGSTSSPSNNLYRIVSKVMNGLISNAPGLEAVLLDFMERMACDIRECFQLRCDQVSIPLPEGEGFDLDMDGWKHHERFEVRSDSLSFDENKNEVIVEVKRPWQHPTDECYPNRHMTDLKNLSIAPYVTQWSISIRGELGISLGSLTSHMLIPDGAPGCEGTFNISTEFAVVVNSGWPLQGVEYTPTSTLGKAVSQFMEGIWGGMVEALKYASNGINQAFSFFKGIFSSLLSSSIKVLEMLSQSLQQMVEGLQGLFQGAAGGAFDLICKFVESVLGAVQFNITIFGIDLMVETKPGDLALGLTRDVLKITLSFSVMETTISVSNRLIRLNGGEYGILLNCTLEHDDWAVGLVVDPLMRIYNHFIEIKGHFSELALVLYLPEIVQYSSLTLSLSDVPGLGALLSNIPTPIPGIKASIDAGFEVKFNSPFINHPVINEYEQNPPGLDSGGEWLEIYNPTSEPISLEGWSVETSHGSQFLGDLPHVLLMPHERLLYTFKGQALDNGGGSKFPPNESLTLMDNEGNRVDSTPWTTDHFNDVRTWQRSYDGSDRWVFKEASKGVSNGKRMATLSEVDFIGSTVVDAIEHAFGAVDQSDPSLDTLSTILSESIGLMRSESMDLLTSCLVELRLFVEVTLSEYTGSLGAGFCMSLVVTENCIEEVLSMLGEMVGIALHKLTNPFGVNHRPDLNGIAEHLFLRFSVYGRAGLPNMIPGPLNDIEFKTEAVIEMNLACLASAFGFQMGTWRLGFGVAITGVPSFLIPSIYGLDAEKLVDIWIIKASLFPC